MQPSSARASIEYVLSGHHLRGERRGLLSLWPCARIVHAEIVLNYISIPNHVFLGDRRLGLPVLAVLQGSARERQLSCAVHLADLV